MPTIVASSSPPKRPAAGPRRTLGRLAVVAALLVLVALHARLYLTAVWNQSVLVEGTRYYTLADDAMISMRYAQNLAQGRGLVWNAGERVEGVTNLGWTLLMAVVHLFGRPAAENSLYVQLANLAIHVALIGCVFVEVRRLAGRGSALLAAGLVAINGSLLCWGTWGFETSLQALLCALALVPLLPAAGEAAQARRFPRTMAWLGLAFVVRPDTLALLGLVVPLGLWWRMRGALGSRRLLAGLLLAGAPVAAVLIFQKVYYDAWLPNTFYLKATGGAAQLRRGISYLADFCKGPFFQLPLLVGSMLLAARALAGRSTRSSALPLAVCVGGWVAYVVKVGGDAFQCSRFFVSIVPLMAAATGVLVARELSTWRGASIRRGSLAWKVAAIATVALLVPYAWRFEPSVQARGARNGGNTDGVRVAVALQETDLAPDAVIALYYAGVLPYLLPEHRFHDLLGKSDRHIARTRAHPGPPGHNKWDYEYSLGQTRPALVVTAAPYVGASDAAMAQALPNAEYGMHPALWIDPTFRALYRPNRVLLATDAAPTEEVMWVYARRDPETGRLPLTAPPVDAPDPRGAPLVSIHPRLAPDVRVGQRFDRPSWGLDWSPEGRFAWLGPEGRDGLGVVLKSAAPVEVSVSFGACPGPGRSDARRTVALTVTNAGGSSLAFEESLTRCEDFSTSLRLARGKNRLRWTIGERADGNSSTPLMASVARIRVGPPTHTGDRRLESVLREIAGS